MTMRQNFYSPRPLDEDELRKRVPSIFTLERHPTRTTEAFTPVPTIEAVRLLAKEGFLPFGASQSRARIKDNKPFSKHMLKFRKPDAVRPMTFRDSVVEVILSNASDGTKAYTLDAGIFKLICLNGLVVKSKDYGTVHIRHTGMDTLYRVLQETHNIAATAGKVLSIPEQWSGIILDAEVRAAFLRAAHATRFGPTEDRIAASQLAIPRRVQDTGRDLWTLFNVVQENAIEGGLSATRDSVSRLWTTRRVSAVDSNLRLNQRLWELAEQAAAGTLKAAA